MTRDPKLRDALEREPVPEADEAEARAWAVVRSAHAERTPVRPARPARQLLALAAAGAVALAVALGPAGAAVGEFVDEVGQAMGIGADDAKPKLRSLPAAGELLVETGSGVWIVRDDGSKRLLGDYDEATWSPRGLFVAAADGEELIAVAPDGTVRWTVQAPHPVRDPRWSPSGFRIAYRSGDALVVVAGDGTGARPIAKGISGPPAWRPLDPDSKLAAAPGGVGSHVLSYVDDRGNVRTIDVDTGRRVATTDADMQELSAPTAGGRARRAVAPDGRRIATLQRVGRRDELVLSRNGGRPGPVLFSARGTLTGPTWSPDGRRLLVGWPAADQWLFIQAQRPGRVLAIDSVSEQFDPGDTADPGFPRVSGWALPAR